MKINDFYKVVRQAAMEAAGYTFPKGSLDSAIAYIGIGATLGRNAQEFMKRPFVKDTLPKAQSLGIVDAAFDNVDTDAVLAGLDVLVEQGVKINLHTFTIDEQEFKLLASKLKGDGNGQEAVVGTPDGVVA